MLAIYPLEVYLTKAFEKIPFLTSAYPQSQLAIKTRLVLHNLFCSDKTTHLPEQIMTLTALERFSAKYYMGRWPRIFNLDFMLKAIAVYALLIFGVPYAINNILVRMGHSEYFSFSSDGLIVLFGIIGAGVSFYWIVVVIILSWVKELDIFFTYNCRTGNFVLAAIGWLTLVGICSGRAILLGLFLTTVSPTLAYFENSYFDLAICSVVLLLGGPAFFVYLRRGIRNIRFDGSYTEGLLRIAVPLVLLMLMVSPYLLT